MTQKVDSITVTVPAARAFAYTWLGKEETETHQLPPYATVTRGPRSRMYWRVPRSSLARPHRAQTALARWEEK